MIEFKGYIFIPHFSSTEHRPMFGKNINLESEILYENLGGNNLNLFSSKNKTKKAAAQYKKNFKDIKKIVFGNLEITIAENESESSFFKDKDSLVTVSNPLNNQEIGIHGTMFLGPVVEGRKSQYPIPCAELSQNGFVTYTFKNSKDTFHQTPYERAYYTATEVNRQGQLPATIAQFKLKIINHNNF